jgi:hypothetical protein
MRAAPAAHFMAKRSPPALRSINSQAECIFRKSASGIRHAVSQQLPRHGQTALVCDLWTIFIEPRKLVLDFGAIGVEPAEV